MLLEGLSLGANLAGNLFSVWGERKRRAKMADLMRKAIQPVEERGGTAAAGLGRGESGMVQGITNRTLTGLSQRGVLDSSIAAGEVAGNVAPVLEQAQRRRDALSERIAAARTAIAQVEGGAPGYQDAFGQALGTTGGFLALQAGIREGRKTTEESELSGLEKLRDLYDIEEDEEGIGRADSALFNQMFNMT